MLNRDYFKQHLELQPSIFRESENLGLLFESIYDVLMTQQDDFKWFSENILNIDTAEKSHLDLIGGLVGQNRFLVDFNVEKYFGFKYSYNSDTFGDSSDPSVGGYWNSRSNFNKSTARRLNDDEYRRLIKARVICNQSMCTTNDVVEVINLITDRTDNTVQRFGHGLIKITSKDETGLLAYFIDRFNSNTSDSILPVATGVEIGLDRLDASEPTDTSNPTEPTPDITTCDYMGSYVYLSTQDARFDLTIDGERCKFHISEDLSQFYTDNDVVQINQVDGYTISITAKYNAPKRPVSISFNTQGFNIVSDASENIYEDVIERGLWYDGTDDDGYGATYSLFNFCFFKI